MKSMAHREWGVKTKHPKTIYKGVIVSGITHGAVIWHAETKFVKGKAKLRSAQRKALLTTMKAYNTVSTDALIATAGVLPIEKEIEIAGKMAEKRIALRNSEEVLAEEHNAHSKSNSWTLPGKSGNKNGSSAMDILELFASSHGRNLTYMIRDELPDSKGIFKPNGKFLDVTQGIENVPPGRVICIIGGTNNTHTEPQTEPINVKKTLQDFDLDKVKRVAQRNPVILVVVLKRAD
ncbi:unnamed protein product [Bemisia tabaci]|uniref:Uncharacterized protein n=1 Tax=Bemisia tabaci TaxID=7038 RepID=A0A9P0A6V0_BEMTA|nr:unnamed protein product [Bemisia tabaci]